MKRFGLVCTALAATFACGPRPFSNLYLLSLPETNQGRALPLHVVPVDDTLLIKISSVKPEEWFVSDMLETTSGIKKRVIQGAQTELVKIERQNDRNDFVVVVDYADSENVDTQRIVIGEAYRRAKDVYILVAKDSIRIVDKKVYEDFRRSI